MALDSIMDGVYQLGARYVNSFVVDGDEGVTLVDALAPKRERAIAAGLGEIGRSMADVKAILLTHSHADHSGSAAAVKAGPEATVYASEADSPGIQGAAKPPPPPTPWYFAPLSWVTSVAPGPPPVAVEYFVSEASGDRLPGDLRTNDTPGHTSYLLDRGGGVLFVGDAARATKRSRVVRGCFNRSTAQIDRSLTHLSEPEFEIAVFGNSNPIHAQASAALRRCAESLT